MNLRRLVNVQVSSPGLERARAANAPADPNSIPVFTTVQTVITFPLASGMITVIWKVLQAVFGEWADSKAVPFVLALIFGVLIYLQSDRTGTTTKQKVVEIVFALLNSMTLAAAALGIEGVAEAVPGSAPNAP